MFGKTPQAPRSVRRGARGRLRGCGAAPERLLAPSSPPGWFGWPGRPVPTPLAIGSARIPLPTAPQRRAAPRASPTRPPRLPRLRQVISGWGIDFFKKKIIIFIYFDCGF